MGFHECEYITKEQAAKMKLRNQDVIRSFGDVEVTFTSGNSWAMPDMARLYVELGWVPPKEFINDVMTSEILNSNHILTFAIPKPATPIGYLNPKDNPLPLKMSDKLPTGFLDKLESLMHKISDLGNDLDAPTTRRQTNGFKPPKM